MILKLIYLLSLFTISICNNINDYEDGIMTWYSPEKWDDDNYDISCSDNYRLNSKKTIGVAIPSYLLGKDKNMCFKCMDIFVNKIEYDNKKYYLNKTLKVEIIDENGHPIEKNNIDATLPLYYKFFEDLNKDKLSNSKIKDIGVLDIKWKFSNNCQDSINNNLDEKR
jgi:hypothetical protein